jgi:glycosyltransferase involved in cell wall biosynthesis
MLSQVDILVNFRTEYRGETSLAIIEAMRFGVVPIVKKVGWYDELPDDAVVKVINGSKLIEELIILVNDASKLAKLKQAAQQYIADNHTYAAYARELYTFIAAQSTAANQADKIAAAIKDGASLGKLKRLLSTD